MCHFSKRVFSTFINVTRGCTLEMLVIIVFTHLLFFAMSGARVNLFSNLATLCMLNFLPLYC